MSEKSEDKLRFLNLQTREIIIPPVQRAGLYWMDVTFSPDGKWLLLTNFPSLRVQPDLQIISFPDYKVRAAYRAIGGRIGYKMCFSGDGKTLGLFTCDAVLYKIDFPKLIDHAPATFKP